MSWRNVYTRILWFWLVSAHLFGFAQVESRASAASGTDPDTQQAQTLEAALHGMADQAAVIFTGTVAEIHRMDGAGLGSGIVEIRFDVDQPLRGCSSGSYVLREWGGFWHANDARYRVGQRLLLLLHAPGADGLSSPVGGMEGAIPLRASGAGVKSSDAAGAAASDLVADLRWIGAKIPHPVTYRDSRTPALAAARTIAARTPASAENSVTNTSDRSVSAQEASVNAIVSMLQSWEGARHATR